MSNYGKEKQIFVDEDGKHGQQRSAEEIEKKRFPQGKSEDEKLTQNKRSRTEHKQLHTTKTGGRQDRARNTEIAKAEIMSSDSENTKAVATINF